MIEISANSTKVISINQADDKLLVYPETQQIVDSLPAVVKSHIGPISVKYALDLLPTDYYTKRISFGATGPTGCTGHTGVIANTGPTGPIIGCTETPVIESYSKRQQLLVITIPMVSQEWLNNNKALLNKLDNRYGSAGNRKLAWEFTPHREETSVKYGVYKKPHFDKVYETMKLMLPDLTADGLAHYENGNKYNSNFVTVVEFYSYIDCISTYYETKFTTKTDGCLTISIIAADLEDNKHVLLKLLQSLA